jgi:formate dehydrogenase subunit delta
MSPDKLAYMANQIGRFFQTQKSDDAVAAIADHLNKFWDPAMRRTIQAQLQDGGNNLDPLVRRAVERLDHPHTTPPPYSN